MIKMFPLFAIILAVVYIAYANNLTITLLFVSLSLLFLWILYLLIKEYRMYELISWTIFIGGMIYLLYFLAFLAMDELKNY